ncbi:uncharacterized protein LOC120000646 [Tripterygium wilfordii]|nr:uncharacterized protein LOC120000646 [Tripterygium wilfordii]
MNCLLLLSSCAAALFRKNTVTHLITKTTLNQCSASTLKGKFGCAGLRAEINKEFEFSRFRVQCFSSKSRKTPRTRKLETEPAVMEQDKDDGFFVVRKGDVVGVYKSFADCQAQLGSSICDPPVSVYKGYSLKKETEDYLTSCGLRDAIYTIRAADLKDDLFGTLTPCPLQEPAFSKDETSSKDRSKKRPYEMGGSQNIDPVCTTSFSTDSLKKHVKMDAEAHEPSSDIRSCILEFDGASKGNPGQAGAGAVLRANDGSVICRLREGLGIATNNVAEYRAMILGLKYALKKGYKSIRVQGDSKLVCMQIQGLWKVKHENMSWLCKEATKLKDKFLSFQIGHVFRDLNSEADAQANLAISLADWTIKMRTKSLIRGVRYLTTTPPPPPPPFSHRSFSSTSSSSSSPLPSGVLSADVADISPEEALLYPVSPVSSVVKLEVPSVLQPRVVVYDGVCHLCHRGVKWVIKADKYRKIKFCCLQSKAAEPYLRHCGLKREDVLRRFLFVEGLGSYHRASTAALKVLSYLPLPYSALSTLLIIPSPVRDAIYDYIARRRYDWFGKSNDCIVLQEKELCERFLDRDEMVDRKPSDM